MKPELTQRQSEVLTYIKQCIAHNQRPPTLREIAARFGFHCSAAHQHVKALQKKGRLTIAPTLGRGIVVLDRPLRGIPLLEDLL